MKKFKLTIKNLFITAVALVVFSVQIYGLVDRFKNPEFHAFMTLDYDKKKHELQDILNNITKDLPEPNGRDDYKRTDAVRISISYYYDEPKSNEIKRLLDNIIYIADAELPYYGTASHSFARMFCVGENYILVADYDENYNNRNKHHLSLIAGFYKYDDCRRLVYEKKY